MDVTDNYAIIFNMEVIIEKATATYTASDVELNYDGFEHTIRFDFDQIDGDYLVEYSLDGEHYSSFVACTDAGVYHIYYRIFFDNYKNEEGMKTLTIKKIDDIIDVNYSTIEYMAEEVPTPRVNTRSDGKVSITFYDNMNNPLSENPTNVGVYKMHIHIEEGRNYNEVNVDKPFTITEKHINVVWNYDEVQYTGNILKPTATISGVHDADKEITYINYADCDFKSVGYQYIEVKLNNDNYVLENARHIYIITPYKVELPEDLQAIYTGKVIEFNDLVGYRFIDNNYINVGKYRITAQLLDDNNYVWADGDTSLTKEVNFEIVARDIASNVVVLSNIANQGYTGSAICPTVTLMHNGRLLEKGVDYTVEYTNNINVFAVAVVTIKGIGNYEGSRTTTFTIVSNVLQFAEGSKYQFTTCLTDYTFDNLAHSSYSSKTRVLVTNVLSNTTIAQFLENISESQRDYVKFAINNKTVSPSAYATTLVTTGTKVSYYNKFNTVVDIVYVAIRGDVNGDGKISILDRTQINQIITKNNKKQEYYYAADINRDGVVNSRDASLVTQHIQGTVNINEMYND